MFIPNLSLARPGFARAAALAAAGAAALLTGCGDSKDRPASQVVAKVNKEEISVHQVNFLLQQQRGLRQDQADAASRQILERLIEQELAIQKAQEIKVDRDPKVVQAIEAARREVVARAYSERVGDAANKPTGQEIQKYFDEKPALFKARRIYNIQELSIEAAPEKVAGLRDRLQSAKNIPEFVEYLKANDIRFVANQAVRAAEQLPLASLDMFATMSDGQTTFNATPTGAQVIMLVSARSQPIDLERARPAIEQFLLNERKRDLIAKDLKDLRAAAKIEYVGKFADAAASVPEAPAATPVAPTASGLAASSINK
jgi:EpsD family peptidyl-prolyl cis-trans isomerase